MRRVINQLAPVFRDFVLNVLIAAPLYSRMLRASFVRLAGHQVDRSATLAPRSFYGARTGLTVGAKTFINYECFFELSAPITIGRGVAIGFRSTFVTSSHEMGQRTQRAGAVTNASIVIGDGCWIGANVTVLPGVRIAPGAIVAAGSVVTKDIATPDLYGGVPAKFMRDLGPREDQTGTL